MSRWLNRDVVGIGLADLAADANYEMVLAVLPLFITGALGAPVIVVGLVEGVADGSSALGKLWSGWYSDRITWRKPSGSAGTVRAASALPFWSPSAAGPRCWSLVPARGWVAECASRYVL